MFQPRARAAGFHPALVVTLSAFVAVSIALPDSARAATLFVSSTADDGAVGTLRSRIEQANAGDPENTIEFNLPSGSEILFRLDVENDRLLPVEILSDITLKALPNRISVGSAAGPILSVDGVLRLDEVSILSAPQASVDLSSSGSQLEIVSNVVDREWGDEDAAALITGDGGVIKSGAKALTLNGAHSYSGATEVQDGDLIILDRSDLKGDFFFNPFPLPVVPEDRVPDPRLIFDDPTANARVEGSITGEGTLIKRNEEILSLTLVDASAVIGPDVEIIVEKGTLQVAKVPEGAATSIKIESGTFFELNVDGGDLELGRRLEGAGTLVKSGTSTILLTGETVSSDPLTQDDWTGATQIQQGTLKLQDVDKLNGDVVFTGAGSLEFGLDMASEGAFDQNITEDVTGDTGGTVVKSGVGELELKGNNSFSALEVNEGSVRGTTRGISGDVSLSASTELIFAQNGSSGSHGGAITGDGKVIIDGPGTVTLSGTNLYTGGTEINSQATLRGTSSSLQGDIDFEFMGSNMALIFDQAGNGDFDGVIDGAGTLEKTGPGDLTVTGANTYTGLTSVNGGGLFLDGGSLTSNVLVASGARLGGEGTITENAVLNGTLKMVDAKLDGGGVPTPVGSLVVDGNVAFNDGSRYEVDLDHPDTAVPNPLLDVGGNVAINGVSNLVAKLGPGTYDNPVERTLISAGAINGSFAVEDDDFAFLAVTVDQDASMIKITVDQDNSQAIADVPGLNANQRRVSAALDSADILNEGDALDMAFRPLTNSQVPGAVDQLAGLPLSSSFTARIAESQRFGRTLMRRMRIFADGASFERDWTNAAAPTLGSGSLIGAALLGGPSPHGASFGPSGTEGYGGWLDGYGAFGSVDQSQQAPGFDYSIGGIAAGIDYQFDAPFLFGGAFSYAHTNLDDFSGVAAKGTGNTYRTSLYGSYGHRLGYVAARADYAYADFSNQRFIKISSLSESASGNFGGNEFTGAFELGSRPFERWFIRAHPFISLEYTHLGHEAFREVGTDSSLDLDVLLESYNSLTTAIGAAFDHTTQIDKGMRVRAELRLRYDHEFLDHQPILRANFRNQFFEVRGVSVGRDTGLVGVGLEFIDRYNLSTFIGYDLRVNSQLLEHNINVGVLFFF